MRCQCQGDASPPPPPQPPKQPSDKPKSSEALAERIKRLKEANATYRQAVQSLSKAQHARAQQYIDASGKGSGAANDASSSGSPPTDAAAAPAPAAPAAVTVATITVEVAPPSARAPTPTPTPAPAPASAPAAPTAAPAAPVPAAAPAAAPASASPPASPPLAVASTSGRVTISSSSSELGAFTLTVDGKPPGAGQLMDVVFVSAEVAPWSKTGGLGDVMGALPVALAARGHRVMVVSPRWVAARAPLGAMGVHWEKGDLFQGDVGACRMRVCLVCSAAERALIGGALAHAPAPCSSHSLLSNSHQGLAHMHSGMHLTAGAKPWQRYAALALGQHMPEG